MKAKMSKLKDGLSAVIIAKDEENILNRTLRHITDIADEVVFIDTGSHDNTVEIAGKFRCRIFEFQWCDDFSKAKNFGVEQARYKWILNVDCDEVLYDKKAKLLIDKACRINNKPAYIIWQDNLYDNGSVGQVKVMRLFRNDPGIRFRNQVHESVCESVYRNWPGYKPEVVDIHLRHYGHLSFNAAGKHERNIGILRKWIESDPGSIYANYKLAMTLFETGKIEESLPQLEKTFDFISEVKDKNTYPFIEDFIRFYYRILVDSGFAEKARVLRSIVEAWV